MRNSLFGRSISAFAAPDPPRGRVESHLAGRQDGLARLRRTACQRAQPCRQFGEGEWLDQIIVRTGVEAFDPIGDGVTRGQEQDRRLDAGPPQSAADLEPVDRRAA